MYRRCLEKAKLPVAFIALFVYFVSIPLSHSEVVNSISVFVGLIFTGFIIGFATNELFYEYFPGAEYLQENAWRNQSKNPAFRDYEVTDEDEEDLQKLTKVNRPYTPKRIKQYLLMAGNTDGLYGKSPDWMDTFDSYKEAESKIKKNNSVEYEIDNRRYEWYQIVDLKYWKKNQS